MLETSKEHDNEDNVADCIYKTGDSLLQYCQIYVHSSGHIQIGGDEETVALLIRALDEAGYRIFWNYKSLCG
mgnify:CR=1 FL=1